MQGKETPLCAILCTRVGCPDKVLCVDRVMCCKEGKFTKMNGVSQGRSFVCVCVCVKQQRKCSLPLSIFRVFVRLQEWNPFAFHIYLHFQGTAISAATLICLFALHWVLLWFILSTFFWLAAKTKTPLSAQPYCSVLCNNKNVKNKKHTWKTDDLCFWCLR